jgi:HEAT repeat protein
MDPPPPQLVLFVLVTAGSCAVLAHDYLERRRVWREAAALLGLGGPGSRLMGRRGAYQVSLQQRVKRKQSRRIQLSISVQGPLPFAADLVIRSVADLSWGEKRPRVLTGDDDFDREVSLRGNGAGVFALAGTKARKLLRALVDEGGSLLGGKLEFDGSHDDAAGIFHSTELLCAVAALLDAASTSGAALLLENVETDALPQVRAGSLRALTALHPKSPKLARGVAAALRDSDPTIQFAAAALAPAESARPVLVALLADPRLRQDDRAAALQAMLDRFGYQDVQPLISAAWDSPYENLRVLAVQASGEAHDQSGFDRFCALTTSKHLSTCLAAVATLGQLGDPRAEPVLIGLLDHLSDEVRVAAIRALGCVGTVRAVEPLLALTRGLLHGEVRAAARAAVVLVQARLGETEAGLVSLAQVSEHEGAVSVAPGGGEVSVAAPAGGGKRRP